MISEDYAKSYCKDDISLIENYDKAIADKTQVWDCHHRRETIYSRSGLIEIGEYYNRPACELIFLTPLEHHRLHHLGKHLSAEARKKISESNKGENNPMFGTHHSVEARKKMSESNKGENNPMFGKHHSAEARKKMSESKKGQNHPLFGKHHSAEARKKMSEALKGKRFSESHKKKIAEAKRGKHWYNNGVIQKMFFDDDVPNGFIKGMKANS